MVDTKLMNDMLSRAEIDLPEMFPHLAKLQTAPYVFTINFGLHELPLEPGILLIRGARQYGKSTWLEQQLYNTIQQFGPGSAYYLNGDNIANADQLEREIVTLVEAFSNTAAVKRLFIDEITAISKWELSLKRLADSNKLSQILLVTTGSKATDLRRGAEKLPGRKGKLARTNYLFTPISYREFRRVCGSSLQQNSLAAYIISGGSPIACSELAEHGQIPEYVIALIRDWIEGEVAAAGRSRSSLLNILQTLFRFGGSPVGQAKLAREAGLANNTIAVGYIELLNDLGCVVPAYPWDRDRKILVLRRPCKYHYTNLLMAISYYQGRIRKPADFLALTESLQGVWLEWLVAQELLRRAAIYHGDILEPLSFWQSKEHEIDFVTRGDTFIEVKRGQASATEFSWFAQQFLRQHLTVITPTKFATDALQAMSLEEFLLAEE